MFLGVESNVNTTINYPPLAFSLYPKNQSVAMYPFFDSVDNRNYDGPGCGWHIVLICIATLLFIGLLKWIS